MHHAHTISIVWPRWVECHHSKMLGPHMRLCHLYWGIELICGWQKRITLNSSLGDFDKAFGKQAIVGNSIHML